MTTRTEGDQVKRMLKSFELRVNLGNEAMQTREDVSEAVREVARQLRRSEVGGGVVLDVNGNTVGRWDFVEVQQ